MAMCFGLTSRLSTFNSELKVRKDERQFEPIIDQRQSEGQVPPAGVFVKR